jgi:hypothetical protein
MRASACAIILQPPWADGAITTQPPTPSPFPACCMSCAEAGVSLVQGWCPWPHPLTNPRAGTADTQGGAISCCVHPPHSSLTTSIHIHVKPGFCHIVRGLGCWAAADKFTLPCFMLLYVSSAALGSGYCSGRPCFEVWFCSRLCGLQAQLRMVFELSCDSSSITALFVVPERLWVPHTCLLMCIVLSTEVQVLNWYILVAASAAGGVPFSIINNGLAVGSCPGWQCHPCCERTCLRVTAPPPPPHEPLAHLRIAWLCRASNRHCNCIAALVCPAGCS